MRGELVAEFGRALEGREVVVAGTGNGPALNGTHLILEGPGSGSEEPDAPMPGTVNPYTGGAKRTAEFQPAAFGELPGPQPGLEERYAHSEFYWDTMGEDFQVPSQMQGLMFGTGWDDNVRRAVGIVANLQQRPDTINILGWSRGGIEALRIANLLYEVYGTSIRVNVFAVDPVFGGLAQPHQTDVTRVPENVRCLVVVLSMHERRNTFRPQCLDRLHIVNHFATTAIFLPMPGGHAQQVQIEQPAGRKDAAKVTWHLAYTFLHRFGTRFQDHFVRRMDLWELCAAYGRMHLQMAQYEAEGTTGVSNWMMGMGTSSRAMLERLISTGTWDTPGTSSTSTTAPASGSPFPVCTSCSSPIRGAA